MAFFGLLDAGPLGLAATPGVHSPGGECRCWLADLAFNGIEVLAPDLTLYETRRELRRLGVTAKLAHLEAVLLRVGQTPVTTEA